MFEFFNFKKRSKYDNECEHFASRVRQKVQSCGSNLKVFGEVDMSYPHRIEIGNECKLNKNVHLNGRSGIVIGDDVTVSHSAMIISSGYKLDEWLENGNKIHFEDRPILIGNHCWIGAGAIILPGIDISGEYVVIGAGSVVTKDIKESRVVVAGNPAKIVKRLGE